VITGLHHAGISVLDLDRSLRFYCDLLGMQVQAQGLFGGETLASVMNLSGARGRSAMLRAGAQCLELFEFGNPVPRRRRSERPVCDHGICHVCVQVTDLQQDYERLRAAGVRFHCPPQPFGDDMLATYARDPDGNVVELLQIVSRNDA
jgi:catechol 2,3-dioxygenase-like lactoylglutathione lyase family enzyme